MFVVLVLMSNFLGVFPPAVALGEAEVHVVACEEGAAVQRELHAGGVRDGLTQQCQVAAKRGRCPTLSPVLAHVARAVENL